MQRRHIVMGLGGVGAVVLAGFMLGLWLSWNAPADLAVASPAPVPALRVGSAEAPVAQIDSGAFVPEPPQPRLDGSRGVPRRQALAPAPMPVPLVSAAESASGETMLSTNLPEQQEFTPYDPTAQLSPPVVAPRPFVEVATVDATTASPSVALAANSPGPAVEGWMTALRADLDRCSSQGMVSRVVCQEQAKWKHCSGNNGWGRVPECPATGNN